MDDKSINNESIKAQTLKLYDMLPSDKYERMARTDIRDEIIELNYSFFGYVATRTFINNSSITYEDKFQSALMHFCECWWWYKWDGTGDPKHKGYRQDLSFSVFFKPRIGEMIERELNEVKYSVRRDLCMLVGKELGKHWGKVTYDDLKLVKTIPADKMNALKAIFGSMYIADLETHAMFIPDNSAGQSVVDRIKSNDNYDSIEEFLIRLMVEKEGRLSNDDISQASEISGVSYEDLIKCLPKAERLLHKMLDENISMNNTFLSE